MYTILVAVTILCACGLLAGAALAIASRVFAVRTDPRIEAIEKILPGANCSGCGNVSCYMYAKSIVEDGTEPNLCVLASDKAEDIGRALGREVTAREPLTAAIRCYGSALSSKQFEYSGIPSCRAAAFFSGGDNVCQFSCLGLGDCVRVCPFGALTQEGRHPPYVDIRKCTGCGTCVKECPKGVIVLVPKSALPHIACSSRDPGKIVRQHCPIGCISCKRCVKICPQEAISFRDNLVQIEYVLCNNCGKCIEECPRNIIVHLGKRTEDDVINL